MTIVGVLLLGAVTAVLVFAVIGVMVCINNSAFCLILFTQRRKRIEAERKVRAASLQSLIRATEFQFEKDSWEIRNALH